MIPARVRSWLRRRTCQFRHDMPSRIVNGWQAASNLLFPRSCTFCGTSLEIVDPEAVDLCHACLARLRSPDRTACRRCGSPVRPAAEHAQRCPRCQAHRLHFAEAMSLGDYGQELQQAVLRMKRATHEPLTRAMGQLLADTIRPRVQAVPVGLVAPIPMHWWRRVVRGTNTARILAETVGRTLRLPVAEQLLYCRRKTLKQGTLRPSQRRKNMRDAFGVSSGYDITDSIVLVVDDIMTTGATASEAARALRACGARAVMVAVVARGGTAR